MERALGQNGSKLSKDMILDCLSYNMRFQGMEKTIKLFLENNAFGFAIGNPNEIRDFIGMLADAHNQTPLPTLRGYSPNEITARWLAQGNRIPMDQFKAVIGKFLESGLWDGDDLRMAVEENKLLSEKAKEELLKELDEVEFESKKDVAKA